MSGKADNLTAQFDLYQKKDKEPTQAENLDIKFAQNLVSQGGKFFYCESKADCAKQLEMLKEEMNWNYIHSWEEDLKNMLSDLGFQKDLLGYNIDNSNAAISGCECLVAESGAVLLAPKQASRRRLPMFPDAHIIIAETSQLTDTLEDAVEYFKLKNKNELPSLIDLSKQEGWKASVKNVPILYADGPTDIYIFLCDEKLI